MLPFVLLVVTLVPRQVEPVGATSASADTPAAGGGASTGSAVLFPASTYQPQPTEEEMPAEPAKIAVPFLGVPTPTTGAAPAPSGPPTVLPERWWLMRELQGTWLGAMLDDNRLYLNGWIEQAYTASTDKYSNFPVIFNDRANEYLLQQFWARIGRKLVTTGTTDISWGFQLDTIIGSDYRWTLPRGLWNSQLDNSTGAQNLYGVDMVQQYVNLYVPTLFRGTEFRLGRFYSPLNFDSIEGVTTPLLSRSYAFENSPFTMCGLAAYVNFTTEWTGVFMLVNGNDVYWGDPSEELRFAGNVKWTQSGGGNIVQLGTSLGRGKFNPAYPTPPQQTTLGLSYEPFGRDNFNVFDFLYTHLFSKEFSYNLEMMYGYQYNVPQADLAVYDPSGFADWFSILHYLFYDVNSRLRLIGRWEDFDDVQGQRTGFAGLYNAVTAGFQYRFRPGLILRPEVRYDYNFESTPFDGRHGMLTAAIDTIVRW